MDDSLIYYFLATTCIFFSLLSIVQTHTAKAAIYLIIHLLFTAGIYSHLGAKIAAAMQFILCGAAILVSFLPNIKFLREKQHQFEDKNRLGKLEALSIVSISIGLTIFSWSGFFSNELSIKISSFPREPSYAMNFGLQMFPPLRWSLILAFLLFLLTVLACWLITKKNKNIEKSAGGRDFDSN